MITQCRVAVLTSKPFRSIDIIDGEPFYSTKHWVVAEYCEKLETTTIFVNAEGTIVFRLPNEFIQVIRIPNPAENPKWITTRTTQKYREEIREIRPNGWNKWTEEEEMQLWNEYHEGITLEEMSLRHGRTVKAIWSRLYVMGLGDGIPYPERGTYKQEHREIEIPQNSATWRICLNCGDTRGEEVCGCWKSTNLPKSMSWRD